MTTYSTGPFVFPLILEAKGQKNVFSALFFSFHNTPFFADSSDLFVDIPQSVILFPTRLQVAETTRPW